MSRALQTVDRPVKIPSRIHEVYYRMKKVHREYIRSHGTSPSEDDLAKILGVTKAKLRFCIECVKNSTLSTDLTLGYDNDTGGLTLGDILQSEEDLAEQLVDDMFKTDLDRTLKRYLNPKERAALRLRFGLDDGGERTLKQISKVLHVSSERTRQIIFEALIKLRKREVKSELEDYMPDLFKDIPSTAAEKHQQ